MSKKTELFKLPDGTAAYLELNPVGQILRDKGLDVNGSVQAFHTQNVLRRIKKYMAFLTGMTIKVTIAQTDINKPVIVTDVPYGRKLFYGIDPRTGRPLRYTKTKNPLAGPRPDNALSAAEGATLRAELQRFINRR